MSQFAIKISLTKVAHALVQTGTCNLIKAAELIAKNKKR